MWGLTIPFASAWLCVFIAMAKNRDPVRWGLAGFLAPIISIPILAFLPTVPPPDPNVFEKPGVLAYDLAQWEGLIEQSEDVRRARDAIAPLGQRYVDQLAKAYLALADKSQLPALVEQIKATAEKDHAGREAYVGQVAEFDKLVTRYFETPTGRLVVLRDGRAMAEIHGRVHPFDDPGQFRRQAGKPDDVWREVTDVGEKADFVRVFDARDGADSEAHVPLFDKLVSRYFETRSGKLIVLRSGQALAEIDGQVRRFPDAGEFRRTAGKPDDDWRDVTDAAEKANFVRVFRGHV